MSDTDKQYLEKYSSAYTLSDMEIFIFPDLLYAILLANIMSPVIWRWRDDSWFAKIDSMSPLKKIHRIKQYIMNNYLFNLDLETWGLTNKQTEMQRFADFIDLSVLQQSNALFGYEGDKYYFDIGIREHFGLNKYNTDIIPYWKTETVEAMNAFVYKEDYSTGAGECVSLSLLYAAALFIVGRFPLEKIFLIGTPLHSQNFIMVNEGVLTNNRRIVTKNMWFNGTALSAKARRALENEKITIVAHNSGYLHYFYKTATIDPDHYRKFRQKLQHYLCSGLEFGIITNFLRAYPDYQQCFQFSISHKGKTYCIPAEAAYKYEHNSSFNLSSVSRKKILAEIDNDECYPEPLANRIVINQVEKFMQKQKLNVCCKKDMQRLKDIFYCPHQDVDKIFDSFHSFAYTKLKLDDKGKKFTAMPAVSLAADMDRNTILNYLSSVRSEIPAADLAFYAYRDLTVTDCRPFFKAALERNPVCIKSAADQKIEAVYKKLTAMQNISIYEGRRLAQPDEVYNFQTGDGLEKAAALAVILKKRRPREEISLISTRGKVTVCSPQQKFTFPSAKNITLKYTFT